MPDLVPMYVFIEDGVVVGTLDEDRIHGSGWHAADAHAFRDKHFPNATILLVLGEQDHEQTRRNILTPP